MPNIPKTAQTVSRLLHRMRIKRRKLKLADGKQRRGSLTSKERDQVITKTGGRCHICGGVIEGLWQADHAFAHSCGGLHEPNNYLPGHPLCKNYRWDYSAEEFQWVLKIGVWARTQIERQSPVGREMAERFVAYEHRRENRRTRE